MTRQAFWQLKQISTGRCPQCGNPKDDDAYQFCVECRDRAYALRRERTKMEREIFGQPMPKSDERQLRERFLAAVGANPNSKAWQQWCRFIGKKGIEKALEKLENQSTENPPPTENL